MNLMQGCFDQETQNINPKKTMINIRQKNHQVSEKVKAALILIGANFSREKKLPYPTVKEVFKSTTAGRTQTYEFRDKILKLASQLEKPVGRPVKEITLPQKDTSNLSLLALEFLMKNPGAVHGGAEYKRYSNSFRLFIIDLYEKNLDIELTSFSRATAIPLGTLKEWLQNKNHKKTNNPKNDPKDNEKQKQQEIKSLHIQTILNEWSRWKGDFTPFCEHIKNNLNINYGKTLIANILYVHGCRTPNRRSGRSPDEKALRKSFETFFPGAQWVGDGSMIKISLNGKTFTFNFELNVDAHTGAFVGASIRDQEDSEAVIEAFEDGIETTGEKPLSILLDNKPSNFSIEVKKATDETLIIRATKYRPQNKGHVEGGFGLFKQVIPPLVLNANSPKELARQIGSLVIQTWGRTINHKPRKNRNGRSRVDIYKNEKPTKEEIEEAKQALTERLKKQEKKIKTEKERQDPIKHKILDEAFIELELIDPNDNLKVACARYPLNSIIAGIATFKGKKAANTLPKGVDGRYLKGIIEKITQQDEGVEIANSLLDERIKAKDFTLTNLQSIFEAKTKYSESKSSLLTELITLTMNSKSLFERLFWINNLATLIKDQKEGQHKTLLRSAARKIHSFFNSPYKDRLAVVRLLNEKVILI